MPDLKDATLTMSVRQLIVVILIVLGGLWTVWSQTLGGVRTDVTAIRQSLDTNHTADGAAQQKAHETETGLRMELAELTAQLRETTVILSGLADAVSGLDGSIQAVDQKITTSIGVSGLLYMPRGTVYRGAPLLHQPLVGHSQ